MIDVYYIVIKGSSLYKEFPVPCTNRERREAITGEWFGNDRFFIQSVRSDCTKATLIDTRVRRNNLLLREQLKRTGNPGNYSYFTRSAAIKTFRYTLEPFDHASIRIWSPQNFPELRFYVNHWWAELELMNCLLAVTRKLLQAVGGMRSF